MVKPALFPALVSLLGATAAIAAGGAGAATNEQLDTASIAFDGAVRHRILSKKKKKKKKSDKAAKEAKTPKAGKAGKTGKAGKAGKAGKGDTCEDFSSGGGFELFSYTLTIEISQLCEVDTPEEFEALENAVCEYFNQAMFCAGCEEGVQMLGCKIVIDELDTDDCPPVRTRDRDLAERELQLYTTTTTLHIYGQARPPSTAPSLPGYPSLNFRRRALEEAAAPSIKLSPERMLQNECPPVLLEFLQEPFPEVTDVVVTEEIEDIDICVSENECESEECCDTADCADTTTLCGCLDIECADFECFCDNEVKAEACQVYEESYSYGYFCETTTSSTPFNICATEPCGPFECCGNLALCGGCGCPC